MFQVSRIFLTRSDTRAPHLLRSFILALLVTAATPILLKAQGQAQTAFTCPAINVNPSTTLATQAFAGTANYSVVAGDTINISMTGPPGVRILVSFAGIQLADVTIGASGAVNVIFPVTSAVTGLFTIIFSNNTAGTTASVNINCTPAPVSSGQTTDNTGDTGDDVADDPPPDTSALERSLISDSFDNVFNNLVPGGIDRDVFNDFAPGITSPFVILSLANPRGQAGTETETPNSYSNPDATKCLEELAKLKVALAEAKAKRDFHIERRNYFAGFLRLPTGDGRSSNPNLVVFDTPADFRGFLIGVNATQISLSQALEGEDFPTPIDASSRDLLKTTSAEFSSLEAGRIKSSLDEANRELSDRRFVHSSKEDLLSELQDDADDQEGTQKQQTQARIDALKLEIESSRQSVDELENRQQELQTRYDNLESEFNNSRVKILPAEQREIAQTIAILVAGLDRAITRDNATIAGLEREVLQKEAECAGSISAYAPTLSSRSTDNPGHIAISRVAGVSPALSPQPTGNGNVFPVTIHPGGINAFFDLSKWRAKANASNEIHALGLEGSILADKRFNFWLGSGYSFSTDFGNPINADRHSLSVSGGASWHFTPRTKAGLVARAGYVRSDGISNRITGAIYAVGAFASHQFDHRINAELIGAYSHSSINGTFAGLGLAGTVGADAIADAFSAQVRLSRSIDWNNWVFQPNVGATYILIDKGDLVASTGTPVAGGQRSSSSIIGGVTASRQFTIPNTDTVINTALNFNVFGDTGSKVWGTTAGVDIGFTLFERADLKLGLSTSVTEGGQGTLSTTAGLRIPF